MSFSNSELELLEWAEKSLSALGPQVEPTTIPVTRPIESAADFWAAIEDARALESIDDNGYSEAMLYFGTFFKNGRADIDLSQIEYVEELDGLRMVIPFNEGKLDGQA